VTKTRGMNREVPCLGSWYPIN